MQRRARLSIDLIVDSAKESNGMFASTIRIELRETVNPLTTVRATTTFRRMSKERQREGRLSSIFVGRTSGITEPRKVDHPLRDNSTQAAASVHPIVIGTSYRHPNRPRQYDQRFEVPWGKPAPRKCRRGESKREPAIAIHCSTSEKVFVRPFGCECRECSTTASERDHAASKSNSSVSVTTIASVRRWTNLVDDV